MGRYLERKRSFEPVFARTIVFGFQPWDTNYFYRQARNRNNDRWPRTTIPRFLQDRLRNSRLAVANGYPYQAEWSKRLRRLLRMKGARYWPAHRIVHHE